MTTTFNLSNFMSYRPVLGDGLIALIDMLPHPGIDSIDHKAAQSARVSYLGSATDPEKDRKLILRLMRDGHTSPFEQVEVQFFVDAPLLVFWQWVRHRTFHYQSVNSRSGRYTAFAENEFYLPELDEWRLQSKDNKQASDGLLNDEDGYFFTSELEKFYEQGYALYKLALAKGVAREQARLFLPGFAVYYQWQVSVDLWNLFSFLRLRMAEDAQYEIRQYALAIYDMLKPFAPACFEAFDLYLDPSKR